MKYCFSSFFVFFFLTKFTFSQEFEVTGTVVTTESVPIVFANVLLLNATDSTIVKGVSTDDLGIFSFDNVLGGRYLLKASYIESFSSVTAIDIFTDTNIGAITISNTNQELDEVTVTYQKPTLERKVDRLVFNVANSALADGTIWELLKQTPNVNVVQNVLTIKGSGNVGVMINGRKVNIPESDIINLLSGSSASNVESIEVITNPPLKYSAEGGMLIDIKMKKNLIAGYNGAIFNNFTQGVFAKNAIGTDHFFKGMKTSFSVNYSFANNRHIYRYTDITNFIKNEASSIWTANQDLTIRRKRHNVSAFFDYNIDDKNVLSVSTINVFTPYVNRYSFARTSINGLNADLLSSFNTINDSGQESLNTSFYANWVRKLQKKGAEFSVGSHYTFYDSKRGQDLDTNFFDLNSNQTGENDFSTQSNQKINLYSMEIDFSSPLGELMRFEAGLRYAGINSESTISQEGFDRSQPGINPTEDGIFTYEEAIYAAYASFDFKWDLLDLKTGLRTEYTETKGELDIGSGPKETSYLEVFPSVALQYNPTKKHRFQFSYLRRIERPRYNKINPFQYFQSNNSVVEGNPDLLPGTRNWISAEYTFDRDYTIEFYYLKWENPYRLQTFQDNENNLLRFVSTNLDLNAGYGIDLTINKDISKRWDFYMFLSLYTNEERFTDLDSGRVLGNSLWTGFVRLNNSFTFLKDRSLVGGLNFAYYAPKARGNAIRYSFNRLNLHFRKTFINKNVSVSFGVQDIFNQGDIFTERIYLNQNNSTLYRPENRLLTLGFRYKFGNTRIRGNKKSKRVEERRRL